MSLLMDMLEFNEQFVTKKEYVKYQTTKYPNKKLVVLTCMDTRLIDMLPKAMNLKYGDMKIVKNAGALVAHPFGSIMRSILVAIYELKAQEVMVIGHHDCGMKSLNADRVIEEAKSRGISEETINTIEYAGVDLHGWLHGFENVEDSVRHSVDIIKHHPLIPLDVAIHGLVIDPETGKLDLIINGNEEKLVKK
ncbi:carbonic anhydrase [Bacillus sp. HMF5848]|uniref:beta-class carbonic anhydrase n=1 Tax=Bacillus sp. HMF5848 TaxID=2495421 RepID=UPI000F79DD1F|nr:carbonic anhydrase [Bacillus sp. HMF5848]RSK28269.1 carbonic anhydrase [Bacillus sp. HMF5848]